MKRRIVPILLSLALCLGIMPPAALAADTEPQEGTPVCACDTLCMEGSVNAGCPVCGAEGADLTQCAGTDPDAELSEEDGRGAPTEGLTISVNDLIEPAAIPATLSDTSGYSGTGTLEDPFIVTSGEGMVNLAAYFDNYIGERHIELGGDIDLSPYQSEWTEWDGLFHYFHGSIDGNGHTISGIPENCYLVYAWHDGTIENLKLDLGGNAATLVYVNLGIARSDGTVEHGNTMMKDVTVVSDTTVTLTGNDQANYAPFIFSSGPYFTMNGCKNYADISGSTNASVFYGYCPLPQGESYPPDAAVNIEDCENHGNVSLRYAGLVFGNPSGMGTGRNITISGLKNYGEIRGTESAHYYCSDAGNTNLYSEGSYFLTQEKDLAESSNLTCDDPGCPNTGSTGLLHEGGNLEGLGLIRSEVDKTFTVDPPSEANAVSYYIVTAYAEVNLFRAETREPVGTTYVSYSEKLSGDNMTTNHVRAYPLTDGGSAPFPSTLLDGSRGLYMATGENPCYWIDNTLTVRSDCVQYINSNRSLGSAEMKVYVSAYDSSGMLLDTAQYEAGGE